MTNELELIKELVEQVNRLGNYLETQVQLLAGTIDVIAHQNILIESLRKRIERIENDSQTSIH